MEYPVWCSESDLVCVCGKCVKVCEKLSLYIFEMCIYYLPANITFKSKNHQACLGLYNHLSFLSVLHVADHMLLYNQMWWLQSNAPFLLPVHHDWLLFDLIQRTAFICHSIEYILVTLWKQRREKAFFYWTDDNGFSYKLVERSCLTSTNECVSLTVLSISIRNSVGMKYLEFGWRGWRTHWFLWDLRCPCLYRSLSPHLLPSRGR